MTGIVLRHERRRLLTIVSVCAVTLCFGVSYAQDDATSLFEDGYSKFQEGDLNAAADLFEKALAANPSDDQIGKFVEGVTAARIYRMVRSDDRRIAGIGTEILQASSRAKVAAGSDVEAVKTAVQAVMEPAQLDEDGIRQKFLFARQFGRNLVPYLIPYLGDGELDKRARAMTWIIEIGLDALPPLVAACEHPDGRIRTNIASLLGARSLRHPYSLGYLKGMQETDELDEVKDEARASFLAVLSDLNGNAGPADDPAKVYFLRTANHFYLNPYRNPFDTRRYVPTLYSLEGDTVVATRVLSFQVSEGMAKQCITEALRIDPDYFAARVLNACNDAARIVEYDENAAWYTKQDGHEEAKALIAEQKAYVDSVLRNRVLSAPAGVLYAAIQQAALDARADVARTLIQSAHTVGMTGSVPEALIQALENEDSRLVRIAAAITVAYWNPASDFDAGQQVIDILASAVETTGVRTVVKGMGNQPVANRFDSLFRNKLNMESLLHDTNVEELLHTLRRSPPDIVFVDEELGYATVERAAAPINTVVNELRKDYRTAGVPVVVVVDPARETKAKEIYESQERNVWVVRANVDHVGLSEGVLNPLFEGKDDGKALATRLAAAAAGAIEYLASVRTDIPVASAVASLGRVLNNRPDSVRIPCLGAIGKLRATSLIGAVAQVFDDGTNKADVREAAMRAVANILGGGNNATSDVLEIIKKGCAESGGGIRQASWIAFGRSGASAADHLALIESAAAGADDSDAGDAGDVDLGDDDTDLGDDDDDDDDDDLDLDDDDDDDDLDLDDDDDLDLDDDDDF